MADYPYRTESELILVPVTLIGRGRTHNASFILDTGASMLIIDHSIALDLGYSVRDGMGFSTVSSAVGKERGYRLQIAGLEALGQRMESVAVACHDLNRGFYYLLETRRRARYARCMQLGIDTLATFLDTHYHGARVGLLCHAASYTSAGQHATDLLGTDPRWRLTTLFGPEHGITSRAEDMEHVPTTKDLEGHTIYSLYGNAPDSLRPTATMLGNIDCLVIDLQDIGTRYYTYIYTMAFTMSACAERGIPVIVCDRPNPIGGVTTEGGPGDQRFASFVGWYPLPIRHGMTIGEVAQHFNREHHLGAALTILPMHGWQRAWHWEDTGLSWINPSPNMRSVAATLLYPGKCLLEATNISEGRGTATPFELCGAPWIDGVQLAKTLEALALPGIVVAPVTFTPTSRKFSGQLCGGIRCTVTDRGTFTPYQFGLALLWALHALDPARFGWRTPQGNPPHTGFDAGPYEFNTVHPAIDLLTRGDQVRQAIDGGRSWDDIAHLAY